MRTPLSNMNGGSQWVPPFMWEEKVRIYNTPGILNNFPKLKHYIFNWIINIIWRESPIGINQLASAFSERFGKIKLKNKSFGKNSDFIGPKWSFTLFSQTFQQNAPYLKFFRDMPLFWNLIFRKCVLNVKLDFWKFDL